MENEDYDVSKIPSENEKKPEISDPEVEKEVQNMIDKRRKCILTVSKMVFSPLILQECIKGKKRLDLSSSRIDDLDALTISMYLTERQFDLELLHLGTNYFSDEGLINVLSGLQYHTNLKELYLGN